MKRYVVFMVMIIFVLLLLSGCWQDPVQEDLLDYINNKLTPLVETEEQIINRYDSVIGENYTSDEVTYKVLTEEVIPKYRDFVEKLEEIQPQTEEVQEVHEIYLSAVNKQYNAMTQVAAAIEQLDTNLIVQANEKMAEGRSEIRTFQSKLHTLAKEHNVEIQKPE